ncbi:MAG: VWA domain-containing protein [Chloroflexota bacterium]
MALGFNYPEFLWLFLLLPLVFFIAKGTNLAHRMRHRRLSIALRLWIVTLLIFTVADAQLKVTSDKLATVFLLDNSDSVGPSGKAQGLTFARVALAKMKDNQQGGVIVFGQDALVEKLVSKDKQLDNPESNPISTYTNLAEAVRIGTALLPGDSQRRLVLVSDGNENIDDVRSAAKIAAANGVQIEVVPINQQDGPEVSVGTLNVPTNLRQGEQFSLTVSVDSNYAGTGRLLILQDGQVISDNPVDLQKGTNIFKQPLKANSKGFVNYTARVIATKDTLEQNNEVNAYSLIKGKPRSLIVEGHPTEKEAANLEAALKSAEIDTNVIPPEKFPGLTDLTQYDSVVMVNVPASSLSQNNLNVLQAYVRDLGKGLVVVGGEESYGLGGYFRTPLEDMLPVELQLPSKLQTPSVAMVLVIDRSTSMADSYNGPGAGAAGIAKIELAKDAAYLAATQLSNTDQVGVLTFDSQYNQSQWQVPLGPMGNPANLVSPIGRIAPGGGTNIYSGFAPAVEALKKVKAANKHIILLTDGQDSEGIEYKQVIADANTAGITVSTVGLGKDVNENFLKNIATQCGGRYYFVDDPSNLPKIFARESHLAARSYIIEEPFTPAIANPSPIIKGLTAMPQLLGYVGTRVKPTATLALVTGRNEPLLAHWQYGLGRVAAWTSDTKGRWAKNWLGWSDFPRFWSQMVRWTIAANETGGLQVQTKAVGNRIYVEADALSADSQYLNSLDAKASIVSSSLSGTKDEITLKQTAPGHYEGYFVPKGTGSFLVNVEANNQTGSTTSDKPLNLSQTVGAVASYSPEYKQLGTNTALLQELASLTGGKLLSNPEEAFINDLSSTTRSQDLWPWLLLLAILLFPFDVGIRRINFSLASLRQGFNHKQRIIAQATANVAVPPPPSAVSRLFAAKERVSGAKQPRVELTSNEINPPFSSTPPPTPLPTKPTPPNQANPNVEEEEGNLTSRLLRAKQRAHEEHKKP